MLKYFVWTVRDLISAGMLFVLVYAFTNLINNGVQKKIISIGTIAGLAGSVVLAFIKHTNIVRDKKLIVLKIYILGIIIVSSIIYTVFCCGLLHRKKPLLNGILTGTFGSLFTAGTLIYALPDVLLYPFHFLIKGQSVFSTDYLFKLIGFSLGILLVFLFCFSLYYIMKSLPVLYVRICTSILVIINIATLYPYFLSPMIIRKWIRVSKAVRKNVMATMNMTMTFTFIMMAVALVFAFILFWISLHNTEPYSNPAEHRKIRARCRNMRRWCIAFILFTAMATVDLTAFKAMSEKKVTLSAAESYQREGDIITIPIEQVSDGVLHRFEYMTEDDVGIRFIIIQKNAFAFGIGFDACEICGATGYYQKNGQVICKLCDVIMNINTIGYKGGCNPIPLPYVIENGEIKIDVKDLEAEKRRFR